MSIEDAIQQNTVALEALTQALQAQTEMINAGIARAAKSGKDGESAPAKVTKQTKTKAAQTKSEPAAQKSMGQEEFRQVFANYLMPSDGLPQEEAEVLQENVRHVLKEFGVDLASEVPEGSYEAAVAKLKGVIAQSEEMKGEVTAYLDGASGKEERKRRLQPIKKALADLGVSRLFMIPASKYPEAMTALKAAIESYSRVDDEDSVV